MTNQFLVIGYGNTLRSDDGVGQKVAEIVDSWNLEGMRSLWVHQLTPELADDIAQVDTVIFVDAVIGDRSNAEIEIQSLENISADENFGHSINPRSLLYLSQAIYGKTPQSYLILIPGFNFNFGEELSEITEQGKAIALTKIKEIVVVPRS